MVNITFTEKEQIKDLTKKILETKSNSFNIIYKHEKNNKNNINQKPQKQIYHIIFERDIIYQLNGQSTAIHKQILINNNISIFKCLSNNQSVLETYNENNKEKYDKIKKILINQNVKSFGNRSIKNNMKLTSERFLNAWYLYNIIDDIYNLLHIVPELNIEDITKMKNNVMKRKQYMKLFKINKNKSDKQEWKNHTNIDITKLQLEFNTHNYIISLLDKYQIQLNNCGQEYIEQFVPIKFNKKTKKWEIHKGHFIIMGDGNFKLKIDRCNISITIYTFLIENMNSQYYTYDRNINNKMCNNSPCRGNDQEKATTKKMCLNCIIILHEKFNIPINYIEAYNEYIKLLEIKYTFIHKKKISKIKKTKLDKAINKINAMEKEIKKEFDSYMPLNVTQAELENKKTFKLKNIKNSNHNKGCRNKSIIKKSQKSNSTTGLICFQTLSGIIISLNILNYGESSGIALWWIINILTNIPNYFVRLAAIGYDMFCNILVHLKSQIKNNTQKNILLSTMHQWIMYWIGLIGFVDKFHVKNHKRTICKYIPKCSGKKYNGILNPKHSRYNKLNFSKMNTNIIEQFWRLTNQLKWVKRLHMKKLKYFLHKFRIAYNKYIIEHLKKKGYIFISIQKTTILRDYANKNIYHLIPFYHLIKKHILNYPSIKPNENIINMDHKYNDNNMDIDYKCNDNNVMEDDNNVMEDNDNDSSSYYSMSDHESSSGYDSDSDIGYVIDNEGNIKDNKGNIISAECINGCPKDDCDCNENSNLVKRKNNHETPPNKRTKLL